MFGSKSKLGISTLPLPSNILSQINTEEQLAEVLSNQPPNQESDSQTTKADSQPTETDSQPTETDSQTTEPEV